MRGVIQVARQRVAQRRFHWLSIIVLSAGFPPHWGSFRTAVPVQAQSALALAPTANPSPGKGASGPLPPVPGACVQGSGGRRLGA